MPQKPTPPSKPRPKSKSTPKSTALSSLTVRVKKKRGRSLSSTLWLERQLNDPYVKQAKAHGYRSRAAYKLKELNDQLQFFKKKCRVVDLGAAPGGWSQVAVESIDARHPDSQVVAVDILDMDPIDHVTFLLMDFTLSDAPQKVTELLRGAVDVVLSDMAPSSTGHRSTDHIRIIALAEMAWEFAHAVLAPGGTFIAKVWQGGTEGALLIQLKKHFHTVKHIKPPASRKDSAEVYVVASGFKG